MAGLTAREEFYVTLPSNASLDLWPDNVLNHYRTKLAQRIDLVGEGWQVGLAELNYARTWQNLANQEGVWISLHDRGVIQFETFNPPTLVHPPSSLSFKMQVKRVLDFLNRQIKEHFSGEQLFDFTYLPEKGEIFYFRNYSDVDWAVTISPSLANYLGLIPHDRNVLEVSPKPEHASFLKMHSLNNEYITSDWWVSYTTEPVTAYFPVPAGYYKSPEILIEKINEILTYKVKENRRVALQYDALSRKVTLKFPLSFRDQAIKESHSREVENVQFNKPLAGMLGFDYNNVFKQTSVADHVIDMDAGLTTLFVYCDIVSDSVVGDVLAPLLRVSQITAKDGDYVNEIYVKPYYREIARKNFETILIYLTDETGRPIQFQTGRVTVTLHFRRRP